MEPILEMRGISKSFHGVNALADVNLTVLPGEIHAVVGENGAGKSTLMKVLSGVYPYPEYSGEIRFMGQERRFKGIAESEAQGIIIIHQELALVPLLSIAENIFLGNEPARYGVIDWALAHTRTRELLEKVGLKESPATLVTDLGIGKQQLVEIAKALSKEVKLLILDEPTASLNESDSDALLQLLLGFKSARHRLHPDLAQAQRDLQGRRCDHCSARRLDHHHDRLQRRPGQRRSDHQGHGRPRNGGPLSSSNTQGRRHGIRTA